MSRRLLHDFAKGFIVMYKSWCTYLELFLTKKSWQIKQGTTYGKIFLIWKYCAKDVYKFHQACSKSRRFQAKICHEDFLELDCAKNNIHFRVVLKWETLHNYTIPPPTKILWFEVIIEKIQSNFSKFFQEV